MSTKNVSPIGPAVWPAIGNNVLFYYIDNFYMKYKQVQRIEDGSVLEVEGAGQVKLMHTPGHTQDHVVVYLSVILLLLLINDLMTLK